MKVERRPAAVWQFPERDECAAAPTSDHDSTMRPVQGACLFGSELMGGPEPKFR
jgi:hypothetical protein